MQIKTLTQCDIKFLEAGKAMQFAGYASKFNGVDSYGDTIAPGAYVETIGMRQRPILMKRNHWAGVIGKWLTMREDEIGLYVEGEFTPGNREAEDTYALVKHGAISGLSIGYEPTEFEMLADGRRLLKRITLHEISVVDSPADAGAVIASVKDAHGLKDVEAILRSRGFSQSEATAIVARVKSLAHGDRADEGKAVADMLRNFKIPV